MKLSVSLSEEDLKVLDQEVCRAGLPGRSAAVHRAIQLLREQALEDEYLAAWDEWESSGEEEIWSQAAADGLA
ncbi:ribbon-helix-helix protein, CopG family [Nocardia neocaledoniensis]|uniref:ribbon-helix-helix protein, CopG family n=1 Tax=Nocardia neocaledoniensis TaxID=236511 RepID=UPI002457854A|nr:ribbon-helix-helix protein, CopG family [Nocardia neocaledoniensis]